MCYRHTILPSFYAAAETREQAQTVPMDKDNMTVDLEKVERVAEEATHRIAVTAQQESRIRQQVSSAAEETNEQFAILTATSSSIAAWCPSSVHSMCSHI